MESKSEIKRIKKDDPQIHLLGAKYRSEILQINENINNGFYNFNRENLFKCIKFYTEYIKYLPEFSHDVLNMCRACLILIEINSTEWNIKNLNKLVVICTTMMICRKDENIIRDSCKVLGEILSLIPADLLNAIVQKHSNTLRFIFQKLVLVQTYYTQMQILQIFIQFTKNLTAMRNDFVRNHRLISQANEDVVKACIRNLSQIDTKNMILSSRGFLEFLNTKITKKVFILPTEGYIDKINKNSLTTREIMKMDINGRNLTISFFVPTHVLFNINTKLLTEYGNQTDKDQLVFLEIECKNIDATVKTIKAGNRISLEIVVENANIIQNDNIQQKLVGLECITIVMTNGESKMKCFMETFYKKFKLGERMVIDDSNSIIDLDSLVSYRTNATIYNTFEFQNSVSNTREVNQKPRQEPIENVESSKPLNETFDVYDSKKIEPIPEVKVANTKTDKHEAKLKEKSDVKMVKTQQIETDSPKVKGKRVRKPKNVATASPVYESKARPKRQLRTNKKYDDYSDLPSDGEEMPSYRDFINKKREKRAPNVISQLQPSQPSGNISFNLDFSSKVNTKTTRMLEQKKKTSTPKTAAAVAVKQIKHFDTDDDEAESEKKVIQKLQKRIALKEIQCDVKLKKPKIEVEIKKFPEIKKVECAAVEIKRVPEINKVERAAIETKKVSEIKKVKRASVESKKVPEINKVERAAVEIKKIPEIKNVERASVETKKVPEIKQVERAAVEIKKVPEIKKVRRPTVEIKKVPEIKKVERAKVEMDEEIVVQNLRKTGYNPPTPKKIEFVVPQDADEIARNVLKRRFTTENIEEVVTKRAKHARIEEWLETSIPSQHPSDSPQHDGNSSQCIDDNAQIPVVQQNGSLNSTSNEDSIVLVPVPNESQLVSEDNNTEINDDFFIDDDHQRCSSVSDLEDSDLNDKTQSQMLVTMESSFADNDDSGFQEDLNPISVYRKRWEEEAVKFVSKIETMTEEQERSIEKYDAAISKMKSSSLDLVVRTKRQLDQVIHLNKRYNAEKAKLFDLIKAKDGSLKTYKMAVEKRNKFWNELKQKNEKMALKIKKDAIDAKENLKQEVWHQFVENIHTKMNNSIQKAYEL